ncbi:MAG: hypothetical protein NZZ41_02110 [Candidatus Dojkabacteria bacterium]|nr:hypothetical protein [Candidatus Dojkabacteria bacterium]
MFNDKKSYYVIKDKFSKSIIVPQSYTGCFADIKKEKNRIFNLLKKSIFEQGLSEEKKIEKLKKISFLYSYVINIDSNFYKMMIEEVKMNISYFQTIANIKKFNNDNFEDFYKIVKLRKIMSWLTSDVSYIYPYGYLNKKEENILEHIFEIFSINEEILTTENNIYYTRYKNIFNNEWHRNYIFDKNKIGTMLYFIILTILYKNTDLRNEELFVKYLNSCDIIKMSLNKKKKCIKVDNVGTSLDFVNKLVNFSDNIFYEILPQKINKKNKTLYLFEFFLTLVKNKEYIKNANKDFFVVRIYNEDFKTNSKDMSLKYVKNMFQETEKTLLIDSKIEKNFLFQTEKKEEDIKILANIIKGSFNGNELEISFFENQKIKDIVSVLEIFL